MSCLAKPQAQTRALPRMKKEVFAMQDSTPERPRGALRPRLPWPRTHGIFCFAALVGSVLSACPTQELAPLAPCTVSAVSDDVETAGVDKVDLLFVIDDSGSMSEEQQKLGDQLPALVEILTKGERPGKDPFPPVRDLHLGVVTSDMGGSGIEIGDNKCDSNGKARFGRDGILVKRGAMAEDKCASAGPAYLSFLPKEGADDAHAVAEKFECLAAVGTNGCGFEQQLEAMYKALAPEEVKFGGRTGGHGDKENKGFLRDDAVLAIIHVSDEEDCSVTDKGRELFKASSDDPITKLDGKDLTRNLRCAYRSDGSDLETRAETMGYVHPTDRYVEGLKALKPDQDRIVFAAIVGIPDGTEDMPLGDVLRHPLMAYAETDKSEPRPACTSPDTEAKPAVRFVRTAQGFGENGVVRSICAASFAPAVDMIIEKISRQLKGACLPRRLSPNAAGVVECDVVEILPQGATEKDCEPSRARKFRELREVKNKETGAIEQRVVCEIQQVAVHGTEFGSSPKPLPGVADSKAGWFYDTFTVRVTNECPPERQQRISFRGDGVEPQTSTLRFECFQPVLNSDDTALGKDAVNTRCEKDADCEERSDSLYTLSCEGEDGAKTCQIGCTLDSQCPAAWACAGAVPGGAGSFCAIPTCPTEEQR
jgi:hypothetical protein